MKIPGKLPIQTITKKLSDADKKIVSGTIATTNNVVSINTKEILYKKSSQSFSVKIMNYIEPYLIKGQRYTLFYTEVDHNLKLKDRVFITGGNYDSDILIQRNKFNKLSDGYTVLYVDKTKVVLDIEYTGVLPWTEEPIDNFIKVYVANNQEDFDYYIRTVSTRDYEYVTNRFSKYGPFSNNNVLYINGTFSIDPTSSYDILGFTSSGSSYLTYSNSFLVLDGFNSGYLKDVTTDILSNTLPLSVGEKRLFISSASFYVSIGGGFRRLFVTFTENHGFTSPVSLKLWELSGTGNTSFWNNSTFTFSFNTSVTLTTDVFDPLNSYSVIIADGIATSNSSQINFNNNGGLFIMNSDFEESDINFKKEYPYYYDTDELTWKVDRQYIRPIITEQNFRNGVFKKGEFNQGLLGTHQEKIDYEGQSVKFTLGTVLNTTWHNGDIGSGIGSDKSYFTQFDEFGLPSIRENESNNAGIGYNYVYDSTIYKSIISNGTYNNTNFGTASNDLVLYQHLTNGTFSYQVYLNFGNYINSQMDSTYVRNSSVFSSLVKNSNFESSKSVNSEFEKTLFLSSKYTSDKIVKILDYDERVISLPDELGNPMECKLYKFYISEDSFERLQDFQSFYFDNLKINIPNTKVLNQFDEKFTIDSYDYSYDEVSGKMTKKTLVQLSTSGENDKTISGISNQVIDNTKTSYPSIDIILSNGQDFDNKKATIATGSYYFDITPLTLMSSWNGTYSNIGRLETSNGVFTFSNATSSQSLYTNLQSSIGSWTYSGNTFSASGTKFDSISLTDENGEFEEIFSFRLFFYDDVVTNGKIIDVTDTYIIDSDFKSGLFKNSTWITGNYINYNRDYSFDTLPNSEYYQNSSLDNSSNTISLSIKEKLRRDLISQNDITFINALYYNTISNAIEVGDYYFDVTEITQMTNWGSTSFDIELDTSSGIYSFSGVTDLSSLLLGLQSTIGTWTNVGNTFSVNDIVIFNSLKATDNTTIPDPEIVSISYYRDSISLGDNLVKLPDTYQVNSILTSTQRTFDLIDFVNGTNSSIYNSPSFNLSSYLMTPDAENAYNYLHPVKFENSNIQSGIFRRSYFKGCIISNSLFNNSDKNPVNYNNWRSLLLSDIIFNDNSNTINSGLLINSHFTSGSDVWENGIVYNSIWNVDSYTWSNSATGSTTQTSIYKFKDGIFRESRWVNGTFENGDFYKNRSNIVFTPSVFDDLTDAYYRNKNNDITPVGKTRYSWINGIFENGQFELSSFENGNFKNGEFFNSNFINGVATSGIFGRRNIKFPLTRVSSGSFSNISVVSAEFRTENPTGQIEGNYQIDWYSGIFNNGIFGVKIDSSSYSTSGPNYSFRSNWHDGIFNNGTFTDIAAWKGGEFNNGKFTSYFGYPFVTSASYSSAGSSSFAWQDGEFNGGEFGTGVVGTNSTWYNGEFNGGTFKGRYWNDGILTRGIFIGSGTSSTQLSNIPLYVSDFSDEFFGLWNNGIVNNVKDSYIKDKKIFTKIEREVSKKTKRPIAEIRNSLWRSGTFSHSDGVFNNSVWLGGAFEKGKFLKSSFNPYVNYLVNGDFRSTDGSDVLFWEKSFSDVDSNSLPIGGEISVSDTNNYSSDPNKKLVFIGTSSLVNLSQTSGLIVGDTYTLRLIVENNYNNEIRFGDWTTNLVNRNFNQGYDNWIIAATSQSGGTLPTLTIATGSPGYLEFSDTTSDGQFYMIYPGVLTPGRDYIVKFYTFDESNMDIPYIGSCDSSQVTINDYVLETSFVDGVSITYSVPTGPGGLYQVYNGIITAEYSDFFISYTTDTSNSSVKVQNLIVSGNTGLLSSDVSSKTSYSYQFNAQGSNFAIELIPKGVATPTGVSWNTATASILHAEIVKGDSGFNISDDCYWDNGTFEDSEFYISKWNNGKWISGTAVGMIWKNGVANYMNAFNIYWEGGVWRNGNWNGSPFSYENVNENGCNFTYQSISISALSTPWNGLDLSPSPVGSLVQVNVSNISNDGFIISCTDGAFGSFVSTYRDPELNPQNTSGFVYTNGYPFVKFDATSTTAGRNYKITINFGTVSFANYEDADNCTIQFSIGRPGLDSYGEFSGTYEGSLYPSSSLLANSEDYVSNQYLLKDLNGHVGSIVPDLLLSGVDGYQSTNGGSITEIITSRDDRNLYIHLNLYGISDLYVDSISIEEENCEQRVVVNEGYTSDVLTNIALYRDSVSDNYYQEIFVNNAFTASENLNWPKIIGQPDLTILSFTQAGVSSSHRWNFSSTIPKYTQINCSSFGFSGYSTTAFYQQPNVNNTNFSTSYKADTNYLIAQNTDLSKDIFTQSGDYQIEIKYEFIFGPTQTSSTQAIGKVKFFVGYDPSISVSSTPNRGDSVNGGFYDVKTHLIGLRSIGCGGGQKWGRTEGIYTATFNPTAFSNPGEILNSKRLLIQKLKSNATALEDDVRLIIKEAKVLNKSISYDPIYNNATYSMFDITPSYEDQLLLPETLVVGPSSNGNLVTTRFGNGIFTSGTGSAFSSIWENGVWNEGFRYDKYVVAFTDFERFTGTSKSFSYPGEFDRKDVKIGNIPNVSDKNVSSRKYSNTNWIIRLSRLNGFIQYENQGVDQLDLDLNYYFKVGDRVSVGNIVTIDINSNRRLIKDYFTVVDINSDIIELQITLNFPIRRIDKDSDDHLIYVSKNIWLNGAFLNGIFKGVWNNGLFKGRPYLTKMVDSQWIDGRFDGGHFRGLTLSIINDVDSGEVVDTYPSGLIQNFIFKDGNLGTYLSSNLENYLRYTSWIDINYFTSSMVNIYRDTISFDKGFKTNRSLINHNGYPTKDILSSISNFKNTYDDEFKEYSLGFKYNGYDEYISNPNFNYPISSFENFEIVGGEFDNISSNYSINATSSVPGLYEFVKGNAWRPLILNQSQGLSYSANTDVSNVNLLKIVSTTQSGANLLENSNTQIFPKFRYSSIEFEMTTSGTISGQFPYLLNEPGSKYFQDSDQVQFISAVPTTIQHDKTTETIKREYFYNKRSLQMVLANVVRYLDSWAVPAPGVIVEPGHGIQVGDIVYISKRDKTINLQIEGIHIVDNIVSAGANPPVPYTELIVLPEIATGYTFTPTGTDGGVLFVYRPYTAYFSSIQMTELDAIPFFLYATQSRIVSDILAPYSAIAPQIDYSDSEFSLIDNINITETIFETVDNPVIQVNGGGNQSVLPNMEVRLDSLDDQTRNSGGNEPILNSNQASK
jgi:hypothetical protein